MNATCDDHSHIDGMGLLGACNDPLAGYPPTGAYEIVKAARAYLQEPTRPLTPAEPSRHLLRSDCSYSSRPTTSGGYIGRHDFVPALGNENSSNPWSWGTWSSSGFADTTNADIWVAENQPPSTSNAYSIPPSAAAAEPIIQQQSGNTDSCLPPIKRVTSSAPTAKHLPPVFKPGTSADCGIRATSAGAASKTSSKAATLGQLVSIRPVSASSTVGSSASTSEGRAPADSAPATQQRCLDGGSIAGAASRVVKPCDTAATQGASSTAAVDASVYNTAFPSTSSYGDAGPENSCPPRDGWCSSSSSRNSSSCGARSRLGSRDSSSAGAKGSSDAADAELMPATQGAEAEVSCTSGPSCSIEHSAYQSSAGCDPSLLHSVLTVVQHMSGLSLSPTDAPSLLQCCAELQRLLATSTNQGCLQDWLCQAPLDLHGNCGQQAASASHPCHQQPASANAHDCGNSAEHAQYQSNTPVGLRDMLIRNLARLVDSKTPDVLIKVGTMLLGITPITNQLLLPAAKMLYSLSKDSDNDGRFHQQVSLQSLLRVTSTLSGALQQQQKHIGAALLYCSGCLKNISTASANQQSLGQLGGVSIMAQVLQQQVSVALEIAASQQGIQPPKHPQHQLAAQIAAQATAVLRNLAAAAGNADLFVAQQRAGLHALVSVFKPFRFDREVLFNASRCLSKLSMHPTCREGFLRESPTGCGIDGSTSAAKDSKIAHSQGMNASSASHSGAVTCIVHALMSVQATDTRQWATGVRLAFVLGQLTSFHTESRPMVAAVSGALDVVPGLVFSLAQLADHQNNQQQQQHSNQQQQQQQELASDLMTKLLRIVANVAIDRTAGVTLASKQVTTDALLSVLTTFTYEEAEELVLNATAVLTNLAFHDTPNNKLLQADAEVLLLHLLPLLTSGNEEATCEAAKAVSNLGRASPAVRAALVQAESQPEQQKSCAGGEGEAVQVSAGPFVLQSLVLLLDHGSWEVVSCAAGALVNITALEEAGIALCQAGAAAAISHAMQRAQQLWATLRQQQSGGQHTVSLEAEQHHHYQLQLQVAAPCAHAMQLLLQCIVNMITTSAAALSAGILGPKGPHCVDPSCSSEDLSEFSSIVGGLVSRQEVADGGSGPVPVAVVQGAALVQSRLLSLWGI